MIRKTVQRKTAEFYELMDDLHEQSEKLLHAMLNDKGTAKLNKYEVAAKDIETIGVKMQEQVKRMRRPRRKKLHINN